MTTTAASAAKTDGFRRQSNAPKSRQQQEYEKKMGDLDARIAYLRARLDDLKGGYGGGNAAEGSPRAKLISELKALREQSKPLQDERRSLVREAGELREALRKRSGELQSAKEKMPFKTVPEIEARIAAYEAQLESGNFKLSEEKQIVAEISKLNKAKRALTSLDGSSNDVLSMKARADALQEKIKVKDEALNVFRTQIDSISAKLDELNGVRAAEKVSKEERQAQIDKLKGELDAAFEARRKAYEDNKHARAAAYEARLKREARFKEERRKAEIEEKIADIEERMAAHNPESILDKKLSECNNMITFFNQISSKGSSAAVAEASETQSSSLAAPVGRTVDAAQLEKFEVVKKDDDDVFFVGGGKKKGLKKASSSGSALSSESLGKLPIHVLAGLSDLNLVIPSTVDQVPILIDALGKVKAAIEQKKAEVEAKGETEVDPKLKALMEQLAALKLELETKPVEDEQPTATAAEQ